jgi:PhnB protein
MPKTTKKSVAKLKKNLSIAKKPMKRANKKVPAIPKGYHSIIPYLIVKEAKKAIEFYKKVFGAKEVMRMENPKGKISHAELKIGDAKIMLADEFLKMNARSPKAYGGSPVGIHLYIKDVDSVIKSAVAAGAKLTRVIENMFYGDRSGEIEDPYGHKWYISTHIENVSPAQMKKRAAEFGKKS